MWTGAGWDASLTVAGFLTPESGKHKLESSAKHQPATLVETTPGETIYVQMVTVAGVWRGGGRLLQVDGEDAQKIIAKLKPEEKEEENKK